MLLRDPVHGLVTFERPEQAIIPALLAARELQRLRRIRQLGLTSLAYPGADHTRFSHALGAAHVMGLFVERLRAIHGDLPYWQRLTSERARDALAAALLHDLGHGPFSHLFEQALVGSPRHEAWTRRIILDPSTDVNRILREHDPAMPGRVAELVDGRDALPYLAGAVSGTFDVDRCDYLLRDAHFTGVSYGRFDLDWLLRSFRFGEPNSPNAAPPLAIDGPKGLPAIESFILARLFMFQQVYFHKASRTSEWMMVRVLQRAHELLMAGVLLPQTPAAFAASARGDEPTLGSYLAMDDSTLWTSLDAWRSGPDAYLAELCGRLVERRLFKTIELFGDQVPRQLELLERARDVARSSGFDPDLYVGLDVASDVPYDEHDHKEPLRVMFPDGARRAPSDVSFLLARLRRERLSRIRLVLHPELREPVQKVLTS